MASGVTLVALICLAGAQPSTQSESCVREVVVRGIPAMACQSIGGKMAAAQFVADHPLYGNGRWKFGGWGCLKNFPHERSASLNPLRGTDQRACLPTIVKRCVIHRETRATICFHVKVGCKNELASG